MDKWLLQKVTQTKINNIKWSDHASVLLRLGDAYPNNSGYVWCSNSQIIQNTATKEILEGHLSNYFQFNSSSTENLFVLWNTHKAYIWGMFIQLGTRLKKQRQQRHNTLLSEISTLEVQNKKNPTPLLSTKRTSLRHDLRLTLLQSFEQTEKRLKMSFYSIRDKAGKTLARRL